MKKFTKLMLAVAVPAAMLAGNANATLITTWAYENQVGFSGFNAGVTGTANNNSTNYAIGTSPVNPQNTTAHPTTLSWGTSAGSGQSSLFLNSFDAASLTDSTVTGQYSGSATTIVGGPATLGGYVLDAQINHQNKPITGSSLVSTFLNGSLLLVSTSPVGTQLPILNGNFSIKFLETPNQASGCTNAPTIAGNYCPDIFAIDQAASSGLSGVALGIIDDYSYFLDVNLTGPLGPLNPGSCSLVSLGVGCIGFVTQEGALNTLQLEFRVRAEPVPVPEPGTLALLGLGLGGLGFGRYRRRK